MVFRRIPHPLPTSSGDYLLSPPGELSLGLAPSCRWVYAAWSWQASRAEQVGGTDSEHVGALGMCY